MLEDGSFGKKSTRFGVQQIWTRTQSLPLTSSVACKSHPCSKCQKTGEGKWAHTGLPPQGPSPVPTAFELSPRRQGAASGETTFLLGRLGLPGGAAL